MGNKKNLFLALIFIFMCGSSIATFGENPDNNKYLSKISTSVDDAFPIVYFFSIQCAHCKQEHAKGLIEHFPLSQVKQYHVSLSQDSFGEFLSNVWAIVATSSVDKIATGKLHDMKTVLFSSLFEKGIRDEDTFLKSIGISKSEYVNKLKSAYVQAYIQEQKDMAAAYKIEGVPSLYFKGKYMVEVPYSDSERTQMFDAILKDLSDSKQE